MNKVCKAPVHSFAMFMLRRTFYFAQDGICPLCGNKMTAAFGSTKISFDHVWPRSMSSVGGGDNGKFLGNIVLAHAVCNREKADEPPSDELVEFLRALNRKLGFLPHETAFWDAPRNVANPFTPRRLSDESATKT